MWDRKQEVALDSVLPLSNNSSCAYEKFLAAIAMEGAILTMREVAPHLMRSIGGRIHPSGIHMKHRRLIEKELSDRYKAR